MADPTIVLLIVVGLTAGERPRGSIVSTAVGSGLGTDARILVEERAAPPTDDEAASMAKRLGGSAVAEIAWADATHGRARLHVYLTSDRTWYDQELSFDAPDAREDRERSIGLLVGAMIRSATAEAAAPSPVEPPAAPPRAPTLPIAPLRAVAEQPSPSPAPPRLRRFGVEAGGLGMAGIGGEAPGLGGAARARFVVSPALSVHGGAALGFGALRDAGADLTTTKIGFGGRWRFVRLANGSVGFDTGVEGMAVHHVVRRASPQASRDRWLSGGHGDVGAAIVLLPGLELYTTAGIDVVLGATPITLAGARVAEIPPARATIEAGARLFF